LPNTLIGLLRITLEWTRFEKADRDVSDEPQLICCMSVRGAAHRLGALSDY